MGKPRSRSIEAETVRITLKVELADTAPFSDHDFTTFIYSAVKQVLGSCGPTVEVSSFDEGTRRGSVVVAGDDAQLVWAAISSFGSYFGRRVAAHLFAKEFHSFQETCLHHRYSGGSKGIGKQLAMELIQKGSNVTIVARNENDLKQAQEDLQVLADQRGQRQKVQWFSLDVTKDYDTFEFNNPSCDVEKLQVEGVIRKAEKELGPVDVLINNAGHSVQAGFEELEISDFENQMRINYLSAVYATRAVVEGMKLRRSGHITFLSSAAGQCAIYGYAAYTPTKFALRGFADALHMELLPFKVNVSVLYPPNTDTEGFKVELESMPEETQLISGAAGLFTPQHVAKAHISDIENGEYATTIGLDGWMLGVLTAGACPEKNWIKAFVQTWLAGLFRSIMLIYIGYFNGIVKRCYRRRRDESLSNKDN